MGNWLPQLVEACKGQDFFRIPATTIAKVPLTLLQLTRQEYMGLHGKRRHILLAYHLRAGGEGQQLLLGLAKIPVK